MVSIGYTLGSEEFGPLQLVEQARMAEELGFDFVSISDHYHPWTSKQGNSPFVWATIGGIAATTSRIRVTTGVTCPIRRIHPAVIAQAAATAASMLPGRFQLGLGAGEALNEHIVGEYWPPPAVRLEMLEEAIDVIRWLWTGKEINHHGYHFTVDQATLFTLPPEPPPIAVAASGPTSAAVAAQNEGLFVTSPDKEVIHEFRANGGEGKPIYGQLTVSWAEDEDSAVQNAQEHWPTSAIPGPLHWDVFTVPQFDQIVSLLSEDQIRSSMPCTNSADVIAKAMREYIDAGIDHVYVHQVGPEQEAFLRFFQREVAPQLQPVKLGAD